MRSVITWAVRNMAGMNVLVVLLLVGGFLSFFGMRRETFPEFQLDVILVTVSYPGATPDEVESGICQKIEESIQAISGIKKLSSICREGSGFTLAQLESDVTDPQKILSEIRSAVDRVSVFFPNRSEKATVEQITFRLPAIRVAVLGPETRVNNHSDKTNSDAELRLRSYTELIRERLLELPSVSQAKIQNEKPYQIDVEIPEATLRKHGLTLAQVAQTLRRENLELPGGQLKSDGQEILLRGKNKSDLGEDIAKLPILSQTNGVVLNVSDLGIVRDAFDDVTALSEVNGRPAMVILIERTSDEDLLNISDEVNALVSTLEVPEGYSVKTWGDESEDVRDRMRMLRENGIQGGVIVFVLLAMFLNLRLAFWVALGIPVSLMGAGIYLYFTGETLNMLTMFAFLMAVGIVVDDGIVIGENIYEHRMMGKSHEQAAIDGALEVLPSVFSSVATTIVAFVPLFYVSGVMGKFIAVMPAAIIAMLLISLAEATFALPGHLVSHDGPPKSFWEKTKYRLSSIIRPLEMLLDKVSQRCNAALDWFGEVVFLNALKLSLSFPLLPISVGVLLVCLALGMIRSGWVAFEFFPQLDGKTLIAQVVYPDGTPVAITSEAARRMEQAIRDVSAEIAEQENSEGTNLTPDPTDPTAPRGPVILTFLQVGSAVNGDPAAGDRISGSHVAQVQVEIHEATRRNVTSSDIIKRWREKAGIFPGAERVSYETANMGPGGKALEFKILAPSQDVKALEAAIEASKKALSSFAGVSDIRDDSNPGKIEYQFSIKDEAVSLGLSNEDLSETVRNSYYGAEVMRLQRGRHEVKLMVRYPIEQRRSLSDMQELRVRGADGKERPLSELADIEVARGYSEINRLDQLRSITVSADVDSTQANAALVAQHLQNNIVPKLMAKYPSLRFRWEGQQQETAESFFSLLVGFIVALMTMYLLLVFEFRSYLQPLIILAIIPFSIVGAIFGHAFMGLPLTLFSMFGMVTLAGVVVNDSIVLVDFINHCIRDGMPVDQALLNAGSRRLRAVFLTSVTTVAGLLPMLLEKSLQAQALIPMATSLAFGLIGSTLLVLIMVPLLFKLYTILTFSREQVLGKTTHCNDVALAQS
ncbi:MAG: efflux RND transporter permease subunit [Planctomycetota bacterium]|nr:efflux RND transporter permease subunit [Planctomycetota bacterium]